jgi:hypothetical protein
LKKAIEWLLEPDQPAVRYLSLTQLERRPEDDEEVKKAREQITTTGWVAQILASQSPEGWWVAPERLYLPKYLSTNWMMLILSDLGMSRSDKRISRACELWIERFAKSDGGFGLDGWKRSHLCTTGNTARALVKFGYADHPKVRTAFEWMVKNAAPKGGWSCFGSGRNLDSWEPLSAFAAYPREKWTRGMKQVVEKGAEFFLEREMHVQGEHYEPWYRFHYPAHYYYDLLVGLEFMTQLGYGRDPRLGHALGVMKKKRRRDGKWDLDAVHPDLEGAAARWYEDHPKHAPTPFAVERVGEPSKMITMRCMEVLKRIDEQS